MAVQALSWTLPRPAAGRHRGSTGPTALLLLTLFSPVSAFQRWGRASSNREIGGISYAMPLVHLFLTVTVPEGICRSCRAAGAGGKRAGIRASTAQERAKALSTGHAALRGLGGREEKEKTQTHSLQDCTASSSKSFSSLYVYQAPVSVSTLWLFGMPLAFNIRRRNAKPWSLL